jgi:D-alanine-D-alanine ligase
MGSSVGINKVQTWDALLDAVAEARRFDTTIVIEAFVKGREIELAVLESTSPFATPLVSIPGEIEVHHPDGFYSYTAKYLESDATLLHIPALLSAELTTRLQQDAAAVFTRLRCRGMARVDFFVNTETNKIYFNEINTLPGFTSISMYPKLWEASGIAYPDLLDQLITLAVNHHQARKKLITHYQ